MSRFRPLSFSRSLGAAWVGLLVAGGNFASAEKLAERAFAEALRLPSEVVFSETGGEGVLDRWLLDGREGEVRGRPHGFELQAGPDVGNDAHHVVLWTRRAFAGDVRIEYDYTRLDRESRNVHIIYLFASGSGEGPYAKDIHAWRERRAVPSMRWYFNHMNAYHISYAAFGNFNTDPTADYVRARRYRPDLAQGLAGTELRPDYERTGLFAPGVPHRITIVRRGADLFFHVRTADTERLFHWDTAQQPAMVDEGPIGLRHMYGRAARYENFVVRQIRSP